MLIGSEMPEGLLRSCQSLTVEEPLCVIRDVNAGGGEACGEGRLTSGFGANELLKRLS